mmetsp:Transcript_27693/g.90584  ORF Transcript_27693/g.90584 Transcript_27693/m.90584 type:complete len:264 (-) Transcript_27693:335-1126(-)
MKDALLLAAVRRRHHNRDRLVEHRLVGAVRVEVDGAEEARLLRVRVDPSERQEPALVLCVENLLLVRCRHRVRRARLLGNDEGGDEEGSFRHLACQNGTRLEVSRGVAPCNVHERVEQFGREVHSLELVRSVWFDGLNGLSRCGRGRRCRRRRWRLRRQLKRPARRRTTRHLPRLRWLREHHLRRLRREHGRWLRHRHDGRDFAPLLWHHWSGQRRRERQLRRERRRRRWGGQGRERREGRKLGNRCVDSWVGCGSRCGCMSR